MHLKIMTVRENLQKFLNQVEKVIILIAFLILVFGSFFRFISRNFLSSQAAIELSDFISVILPHIILIMGFLGASLGISRGEVIKIDLFKNFINEKYYKKIFKFTYFLTGMLLILFIFLAIKSLQFGDFIWILIGYIPAFFLMLIKISLNLAK